MQVMVLNTIPIVMMVAVYGLLAVESVAAARQGRQTPRRVADDREQA